MSSFRRARLPADGKIAPAVSGLSAFKNEHYEALDFHVYARKARKQFRQQRRRLATLSVLSRCNLNAQFPSTTALCYLVSSLRRASLRLSRKDINLKVQIETSRELSERTFRLAAATGNAHNSASMPDHVTSYANYLTETRDAADRAIVFKHSSGLISCVRS